MALGESQEGATANVDGVLGPQRVRGHFGMFVRNADPDCISSSGNDLFVGYTESILKTFKHLKWDRDCRECAKFESMDRNLEDGAKEPVEKGEKVSADRRGTFSDLENVP
jgi:hypothetical protein